MNNILRFYLSVCCLILFFPTISFAQADSANVQSAALTNAKAVFDKGIGRQSALYNGPQYTFYNPQLLKGSAYFMESTALNGNVNYDDTDYKGIQLIYDVYKDELVTLLYDNYTFFTLVKEDVKNFDLGGHHFINIYGDTLNKNSPVKKGYYDELYNGRTQVLVRITKQVQIATSSIGTPEAYSFFTKPDLTYFIRKSGIYYEVSGENDALDILKDKKEQLKKFIRANRIKYRKDPGPSLAKIAVYYDSISN